MSQTGDIIQTIQDYMGETIYLPMFLCCLLICYCTGKKDSRKRILWLSVLGILAIFNNVSIRVIGKFTDTITYYRFLWAVPVLLAIAYVITKAITGLRKIWEKAVVLGVVLLLSWGFGSSFVTEESLRFPENKYNLPAEAIAVCDIIAQDKDEERPVVAFDMGTQLASRAYDPSIVWGIRRKAYIEHNDMEGYEEAGKYKADKVLIHAVNYGVQGEGELLKKALSKRKVDYIVTFTGYGMDAYFEGLGYSLVGRCGEKSVYGKGKGL